VDAHRREIGAEVPADPRGDVGIDRTAAIFAFDRRGRGVVDRRLGGAGSVAVVAVEGSRSMAAAYRPGRA
jgi:hypothetical protein